MSVCLIFSFLCTFIFCLPPWGNLGAPPRPPMVSSKLVHMSVNNLSMHWMWGKVAEDLPISSACSLMASKIMVLCCTSFSLFVFHCNRNNNNKLTTTTTTTTTTMEIWYYHILIMQTACSYHQSHWIKPEMYRRSHAPENYNSHSTCSHCFTITCSS